MASRDNLEVLKENLAELKQKINDMEGGFVNKAERYGRQAKDKVIEVEEQVKHRIEEHPFQTMGIAFGAGAIAGMIAFGLLKKK